MRAIIEPGPQHLAGVVQAQPSKNYTTRYLLAAGLAPGVSTLHNVASSDDSHAMQHCLAELGAGIERLDEGGSALRISGFGASPRTPATAVNPGNAGAVLRFLLAVGALLDEVHFETDRPDSLGKRPNADLLDALTQLGCEIESNEGRLPITIRGGRERLHGGTVSISGEKSSQFLSGLLFVAPLIGAPVSIRVTGALVSKAPVRQTLEVLATAGIHIQAAPDLMAFEVHPANFRPGEYAINGDWPGSAALLAAAAVAGEGITVAGLLRDEQGERLAADALEQMGARIEWRENSVVAGAGALRGIEFDGDLATDAVLALMGAAALADGRTRIYNVSNLRLKECDRITEPIAELRKIGVRCWEGHEIGDSDPDAIIIEGKAAGYEGGIEVDGRRDHRVIMMETIVGLRCRRGLVITGAEHISKSYPNFFSHLGALGARLRLEED